MSDKNNEWSSEELELPNEDILRSLLVEAYGEIALKLDLLPEDKQQQRLQSISIATRCLFVERNIEHQFTLSSNPTLDEIFSLMFAYVHLFAGKEGVISSMVEMIKKDANALHKLKNLPEID